MVSIAGWMIDPVVCGGMTMGPPGVDLVALIELNRLVTRTDKPAVFRSGEGNLTISALLAKGQIQTKIIVLILPLLIGIFSVAAVSYLSSKMLDRRLEGTNASILTLGGYKQAQEQMSSFLSATNEENMGSVKRLLDAQVSQLDDNKRLASSPEELKDLDRAREITLDLHAEVDELWTMYQKELQTRADINAGLRTVLEIRSNIFTQVTMVGPSVAANYGSSSGLSQKLDNAIFEARIASAELLGTPTKTNMQKYQGKLKNIGIYVTKFQPLADQREAIKELITQSGETIKSTNLRAESLIDENEQRHAAYAATAVSINEAWEHIVAFADKQRAGAADVQQESQLIALTSAGVASLFGLAASAVLVYALKGPIQNLTTTMRTLSLGDLSIEVAGIERTDEIGEMARALTIFRENAFKKLEAERQADEARGIAGEQHQRREFEKQRDAEQTKNAVTVVAHALGKLAEGDLTIRIVEPFRADLDQLRVDYNMSLDRLSASLQQANRKVSLISKDMAEMQVSADDLSRRTEQQAASVEETSAALSEIVTMVSAASQVANDVEAAARHANKEAEASREVVFKAVNAMSEIESSSVQISTIADIIEQIAFQTNLLALNAGVEAARAGESGKGFAVVAHEVRELAQRTGTAVVEIRELISLSGNQVSEGVEMVRAARAALDKITGNIATINSGVHSVAEGASNQSARIREISHAVNLIDKITQQNGMMVEATNAVVTSVTGEIFDLHDLLHNFKLPEIVEIDDVQIVAA